MRDCQAEKEGRGREREVGDSRKFCNSPAEQVKCATCFHFRSLLSPSTFPPSLYNKLDGGQGGGAEGSPRDEEATVWRLLRDKINCNAASGNGSVGLKYWRTDATYGTCISARICSSRKKRSKNSTKVSHWKKEALYQPSFLFYPSTLFMQSARRRPNGVPKGNVI